MITAAQQALVPLLRAAESVLPAERLASTPGLRALGRVLLRWCVHALARRRGLDVDLRSIAAPVRESWSAELRECVDALDDLAWLDAACERELAERLADALAQAERMDRALATPDSPAARADAILSAVELGATALDVLFGALRRT